MSAQLYDFNYALELHNTVGIIPISVPAYCAAEADAYAYSEACKLGAYCGNVVRFDRVSRVPA